MVGVAIVDINNPGVGTVTDIDGNYTITVNTKKPTKLSYSFMGYETETRIITSMTTKMNIAMSTHNKLLDEVVITAVCTSRSRPM